MRVLTLRTLDLYDQGRYNHFNNPGNSETNLVKRLSKYMNRCSCLLVKISEKFPLVEIFVEEGA